MTRAGGVSNELWHRLPACIKLIDAETWGDKNRKGESIPGVGAGIDQAPQRDGLKRGRFKRYGPAQHAEGKQSETSWQAADRTVGVKRRRQSNSPVIRDDSSALKQAPKRVRRWTERLGNKRFASDA